MSMTLMPCNGPMASFTPFLVLSGQVTAGASRDQGRWAYGGMRFISSHSGAMRSIEPQCAIAHCGISRFRVWSFGPSRNDVLHGSAISLHGMPESSVDQAPKYGGRR